jgi:hypothetical protein
VQALIKAFAPHRGLVAGELIAGCNDIGVGDFVLFGRAHMAASIIFLRSSSKEASMLHTTQDAPISLQSAVRPLPLPDIPASAPLFPTAVELPAQQKGLPFY